jgi:hypothetical protein
MQAVSFNIPRLYDDVSFRIGGISYDTPFCYTETENVEIMPFSKRDFEFVDRITNTEDLQTFFGIADRFGTPILIGMRRMWRGSALLDAARLRLLNAELTPLYGYPAWLSLPLKDWVKYEMTKQNNLWLSNNGGTGIETTNNELRDFANNFAKEKALVKKFQFKFKMDEPNILKQIKEPFFFFDRLEDGAEYKKYFQPNVYLNRENKNPEIIEVLLPKKYPLDYIKYFGFKQIGDKGTNLTAYDAVKNHNDAKIENYLNPLYSSFAFSDYPIFDTFPNVGTNERYNITIFYEPQSVVVAVPKKFPKRIPNIEPENTEPESTEIAEIAEPPKPAKPKEKTTKPEVANWFIPLVVFFIVLVVLQKSSS